MIKVLKLYYPILSYKYSNYLFKKINISIPLYSKTYSTILEYYIQSKILNTIKQGYKIICKSQLNLINYILYLVSFNTYIYSSKLNFTPIHKNFSLNFPIISTSYCNIYTSYLKELQIQLFYIQTYYLLNNRFKLFPFKENTIFTLTQLENIFELISLNKNKTLNTKYLSFQIIYNIHQSIGEIKFKNIITNQISIITFDNQFSILHYLVVNSKINFGGEFFLTGIFLPKESILHYYNNVKIFMNCYKSTKYSLNFSFNLLLETLILQYKYHGIILPSIVFELIIMRLISNIIIINNGNTNISIGTILNFKLLTIINNSYSFFGLEGCYYKPILLGLTKVILVNNGVLASLSFQQMLSSLSMYIIQSNIDWIVDLKSKIITSELLEVGSGWYKRFIS